MENDLLLLIYNIWFGSMVPYGVQLYNKLGLAGPVITNNKIKRRTNEIINRTGELNHLSDTLENGQMTRTGKTEPTHTENQIKTGQTHQLAFNSGQRLFCFFGSQLLVFLFQTSLYL